MQMQGSRRGEEVYCSSPQQVTNSQQTVLKGCNLCAEKHQVPGSGVDRRTSDHLLMHCGFASPGQDIVTRQDGWQHKMPPNVCTKPSLPCTHTGPHLTWSTRTEFTSSCWWHDSFAAPGRKQQLSLGRVREEGCKEEAWRNQGTRPPRTHLEG